GRIFSVPGLSPLGLFFLGVDRDRRVDCRAGAGFHRAARNGAAPVGSRLRRRVGGPSGSGARPARSGASRIEENCPARIAHGGSDRADTRTPSCAWLGGEVLRRALRNGRRQGTTPRG